MLELVKKGVFTGIGLISLSKEKIEEVAQEFIEKGKMSEEEGQKFVSELVMRSEESKQAIKKQVEASVKRIMTKMDLATKEDVASLHRELAEVRAKLETNEK